MKINIILSMLLCSAYSSADVSIYGFASGGAEYVKREAISINRVSDYTSRIGLRGSDELSSSTNFIWQIESGVSIDDGTVNPAKGSFGSRNNYVGLKMDGLGSVKIGKHDTAYKMSGMFFNPIAGTTADACGFKAIWHSFDQRSPFTTTYPNLFIDENTTYCTVPVR